MLSCQAAELLFNKQIASALGSLARLLARALCVLVFFRLPASAVQPWHGCARGGDNQLTLGSASFLLGCSDVVQIEENAAKRLLCECARASCEKKQQFERVSYKVTPGKTRIPAISVVNILPLGTRTATLMFMSQEFLLQLMHKYKFLRNSLFTLMI
jgi:hypothetical protein